MVWDFENTSMDNSVMFAIRASQMLHSIWRKHLLHCCSNVFAESFRRETNYCLYDQISYGRFSMNHGRACDIDLFLVQTDGKKIVDPRKQKALSSRLEMELVRPLRVATVSRGPDTELLVANPVELSGKGRPLVFHDITLALKMLNTCIFSVLIHLLNKLR